MSRRSIWPIGRSAHAIPENDHEAAQMLGNLLNKKTIRGKYIFWFR